MAKFSRQTVDAFQAKLSEIDEAWQDELNLYETVRQSFDAIARARSYKATWEQIATILMEASDSEVKISPESIRQYYYEFAAKPELFGKKKKTKSRPSDRHKKDTITPQPEGTVTISQPIASDAFVSGIAGQEKGSVESQFNLSRKRQ